MKSPAIRVSLAFRRAPDSTLVTFARNVHKKIYLIPEFTKIPVTAPVLLAAIVAFADAKAAQANGGKAATAEKNKLRDELMGLLRSLAFYAQTASEDDLALFLSSGFLAMNTNRRKYPLAQPMILRVTNGMSGTALVTLSPQPVARGCEIRVAEIGDDGSPGEFRSNGFNGRSRNVAIEGLVPGRLYAYQGRHYGGSTVYSEWSDLLVHRAM